MCTRSHSNDTTALPGLYLVATPIGNLGDLSPRARTLLEAATLIASEDTRTTRKLLGRTGAAGRMVSLTEHNVEARIAELLAAAETGVVVIVSEAGTPGIADPGTRLVMAAHRGGVPVYAVPGPSALAAALAASGFDASWSLFLGFLPKKRGERTAALERASACARTIVFFENPGRLSDTLQDVATTLANPETVVCREMSKVHEEIVYGPALELAERFRETRGECTVVVRVPEQAAPTDLDEALDWLAAMRRAGAQRSAAAAEVSRRTGQPRDALYRAWDDA
jgi:16S rRNA (cytidine1402-2'-O)-methyltransferase